MARRLDLLPLDRLSHIQIRPNSVSDGSLLGDSHRGQPARSGQIGPAESDPSQTATNFEFAAGFDPRAVAKTGEKLLLQRGITMSFIAAIERPAAPAQDHANEPVS